MERISLCIVACDEEDMLPGCLESVQGAVEEIVLVDAGSTDRTAAIAREAGARVLAGAWGDDFSTPRNEAARLATGDFILQLDADERLAPGAGPRLRAAAARPGFDAFLLRLHDADRPEATPAEVISGAARAGPPSLLPRLVRRAPDLEWRGMVHESISDWLAGRGMRTAPADVDIVHLGQLWAAPGKQARKLALLRRRCALEPDSVTPFGYLALELVARGETREAAEVAERGFALVALQPPDRSLLRIAVARGQVALHELRPAAALEAVQVGLDREGPGPDLLHLRGQALALLASQASGAERARLLGEAALAFVEALRFEGTAGVRQVLAGASSWASWGALGGVRIAEGRPAEALRCFERALLSRPGDREARLGLAEVTLDRGDAAGALVVLERLLDDGPDGWTLAAVAASALGYRRDAAGLLRRAAVRAGRGFAAPHRGERFRALRSALAPGDP